MKLKSAPKFNSGRIAKRIWILLAAVNTFVVDEDANHVRVMSTGTHDKVFMRSVAKNFPKRSSDCPGESITAFACLSQLISTSTPGEVPSASAAWKATCSFPRAESVANLKLTGGTVSATIAVGALKLEIPTRSWRGVGATVQIAVGDITVEIPAGFSGDFDAEVLRAGKIDSSYEELARASRGVDPRTLLARPAPAELRSSLRLVMV